MHLSINNKTNSSCELCHLQVRNRFKYESADTPALRDHSGGFLGQTFPRDNPCIITVFSCFLYGRNKKGKNMFGNKYSLKENYLLETYVVGVTVVQKRQLYPFLSIRCINYVECKKKKNQPICTQTHLDVNPSLSPQYVALNSSDSSQTDWRCLYLQERLRFETREGGDEISDVLWSSTDLAKVLGLSGKVHCTPAGSFWPESQADRRHGLHSLGHLHEQSANTGNKKSHQNDAHQHQIILENREKKRQKNNISCNRN